MATDSIFQFNKIGKWEKLGKYLKQFLLISVHEMMRLMELETYFLAAFHCKKSSENLILFEKFLQNLGIF